MPRSFHQDPTQFFSVVGAPYVCESRGAGHYVHERRTGNAFSRRFGIGAATVCTGFCAVALGVSSLASAVATQVVK